MINGRKAKMSLRETRATLESAGFFPTSETRLPNDTGVALRLDNGAIANVFDSGAVTVQGKNRMPVETALRSAIERRSGSLAALFAER